MRLLHQVVVDLDTDRPSCSSAHLRTVLNEPEILFVARGDFKNFGDPSPVESGWDGVFFLEKGRAHSASRLGLHILDLPLGTDPIAVSVRSRRRVAARDQTR